MGLTMMHIMRQTMRPEATVVVAVATAMLVAIVAARLALTATALVGCGYTTLATGLRSMIRH